MSVIDGKKSSFNFKQSVVVVGLILMCVLALVCFFSVALVCFFPQAAYKFSLFARGYVKAFNIFVDANRMILIL